MRSLHRAHVDRFLRTAIPSTPGLRGLHLGSGPGPRGTYRPPDSQHWINVDLTCGAVRADVRDLPFRRQSFDCVRATEFLYHIEPQDLHRALGECRRVLTRDGRLVITAPLLVPPINADDVLRLTAEGWRRALRDFRSVTMTTLGGFWSHLVITLEHLSPACALLRGLAKLDTETYPHAYGIVAHG